MEYLVAFSQAGVGQPPDNLHGRMELPAEVTGNSTLWFSFYLPCFEQSNISDFSLH
jgi:hypothetical protein